MNARTSSGIAAIWRSGEVRDTSVIPRSTQAQLKLIGDVTLNAVSEALMSSKNFKPPEWHKPGENYLDHCRIAWILGELAQQVDGLQALVLREATFSEFCDIGIGLQTGMAEADAAGRQMLGITDPQDQRLLDFARTVCTGRLYVPVGPSDSLDGAGMQLLLGGEPLPVTAPVQQQTVAA